MIRVVLDTNVIVSAFLSPRGLEAAVLQLGLAGILEISVSPVVLAEYVEVLSRPRFNFDPRRVAEGLAEIRRVARLVKPSSTLAISTDDADNRILECAEAAQANFLVTGNRRHFPLEWEGTRIVNARQLIEQLT